MTDQLDARIRALVLEVVDSGPVAPTFEDIESGMRELVVRRRVTRRAPVVVAIAACLAVALVIGGAFLLSGRNDSPSVRTPAGPPGYRRSERVCGQGLCEQQPRWHAVGDHDVDGQGVVHDHGRRTARSRRRITPDGKLRLRGTQRSQTAPCR